MRFEWGTQCLLLGLVWSNERITLFTGRNRPLIGRMAAGHSTFLLLISGMEELGLFTTPHLPDWFDELLGISRSGRPAGTGFQFLQMAAFVLILLAEWAWLSLLVSRNTARTER